MTAMIVILGLFVLVAFYVVGVYNRFVTLRNQTQNGWSQIDVQLKRRHDLIPNLVNTVKGVMEFERDTLTAVVDARARAVSAAGPAAAARAEGELTQALGRLFALAENYPQLKSNENVKMLQEELSSTENGSRSRASSATTSPRSSTRAQVFPVTCSTRCSVSRPPNSSSCPRDRAQVRVDLSMRSR
jgi:LemA protein